ncbi:MAG TPA: hypothetical protein VLZ75_02975 [Chitinophagales bacterium]|nr:hypothetical protein [Chitinophagales bacterium]
MNLKIEVGKKTYKLFIPSSPEEMKSEDWLFVYEQKELGLRLLELQLRFLLNKFKVLPQKVVKSLSDEQMVDICDKLYFISDVYALHFCPIPQIEIEEIEYKSIDDIFSKIKGTDYAFIESYYNHFKESDDIFELFKIMSILYAPQDKPFDEKKILERAELFRTNLSVYHAQLISDWYNTIHKELETEFEDVFKGDGSNSQVESLGFIEVIYSLAGDKLGPVEKVENQIIREIFTAALLEMNSAKRIKEAMNKKT